MFRTLLFFMAALALPAAEDAWDKVRELKAGTELRVYKTGVKKPLAGKLDAAREDALVLIQKNAQISIPRDQVERIDCRAGDAGGSVAMHAGRHVGTKEDAAMGHSKDSTLPPDSTATGVRIRPPRGFETVYRRSADAPAR